MARLMNRIRRFIVDERPVVRGLHAVGDAHTCTNPLYGRGCSLAMVQATALAEAVRIHPGDADAQSLDYETACRREIEPWYDAAVAQDRRARRASAQPSEDADESDPDAFLRAVMRHGLLPAMRTDATVLRAFLRAFNLLTPPDALLGDADVLARVLAVYHERGGRPADPPLGPSRDELLAALSPGAGAR
jgi:flavin-dependent dehydrogenase